MILAAKTNKRRQGFTLLEIVIVLGVAALIIGGVVGSVVLSSDQRTLSNTVGEIELLAKRARTISILKQTPYALEFREGVVRLMPLAQAGMPEKRKSLIAEEEAGPTDESRVLKLEDSMTVSILRWNSEKWLTTTKDTIHIWRFDPDGLCEPISLRLTFNQSSAQNTYHPLTATAIESESYLEIR
jgi:type II secretion system protein H